MSPTEFGMNSSREDIFNPNTKRETLTNSVRKNDSGFSALGDSRPALSSSSVGQNFRKGGFRRLTDAEFQSKMEKGLCYRCDEKFGPGHKCKFKQLQILLVVEGENKEEGVVDEASVEEVEAEDKVLELSINSMSEDGLPTNTEVERDDGREEYCGSYR